MDLNQINKSFIKSKIENLFEVSWIGLEANKSNNFLINFQSASFDVDLLDLNEFKR